MSEALGTRVYADTRQDVMYGGNNNAKMSDNTINLIDKEVSRILDEQYERAKKILEDNRDIVELMASCLMEYETLDADQITEVMKGIKPKPLADLPTPKSDKKK